MLSEYVHSHPSNCQQRYTKTWFSEVVDEFESYLRPAVNGSQIDADSQEYQFALENDSQIVVNFLGDTPNIYSIFGKFPVFLLSPQWSSCVLTWVCV